MPVLDEHMGILSVAVFATHLLVLLIAFNTSSIGMDERARDHVTMLTFGPPVRSVLALTVVETAMVGAIATAAGIVGG